MVHRSFFYHRSLLRRCPPSLPQMSTEASNKRRRVGGDGDGAAGGGGGGGCQDVATADVIAEMKAEMARMKEQMMNNMQNYDALNPI